MADFAWLHLLTASPGGPSAGGAGFGRIACDLSTFVRRDVGLSELADAQGMRRFREQFPDLLMLVLTVHKDDPRTVAELCSAACDYLLKKTPETPRPAPYPFPEATPPEQPIDQLTPHEVRMLKLLVDGHSYKTAAAALGVSRHTVSFHLRSVYEKLRVHSKSEAVSKALRDRLV